MAKLLVKHLMLLMKPGDVINVDIIVDRASKINFEVSRNTVTARLNNLYNNGTIKRLDRGEYLVDTNGYAKMFKSIAPIQITKSITQYLMENYEHESVEELLKEQKVSFKGHELEAVLDQIDHETKVTPKPDFNDLLRLM